MATPVILPKQGNSVERCLIMAGKKQIGDKVKAGEVLVQVETDKAVVEIESPENGVLLAQFFSAGSEAPVMTNIAVVGQEGEDVEAFRPQQTIFVSGDIDFTPFAGSTFDITGLFWFDALFGPRLLGGVATLASFDEEAEESIVEELVLVDVEDVEVLQSFVYTRSLIEQILALAPEIDLPIGQVVSTRSSTFRAEPNDRAEILGVAELGDNHRVLEYLDDEEGIRWFLTTNGWISGETVEVTSAVDVALYE